MATTMATKSQIPSDISKHAAEAHTTTATTYPSPPPPAYARIPPSLKAAYTSSRSKLLCCNSSNVDVKLTPSGETTTSTGGLKLTLPGGWSGSLVLRGGDGSADSEGGAPLARAVPGGRREYEILLPQARNTLEAEVLRRRPRSSVWWFVLDGGAGGGVELFEWRRSRGEEVKRLGAAWRGWKLVRVRGGARESAAEEAGDESGSEEGDFEKEKEGGGFEKEREKEGDEVVAVWARSGRWTSLHDVGELRFLGAGASGELGERWAVMALMSCFCIWQKAMRDQNAAAVASAGSSSAVVVTS